MCPLYVKFQNQLSYSLLQALKKGATDNEKEEFLKEALLMSNFKHRHILSLLGVCLQNDPQFLILELMDGGDLLTYLRASRSTPVSTFYKCIPQLVWVLKTLKREMSTTTCMLGPHRHII